MIETCVERLKTCWAIMIAKIGYFLRSWSEGKNSELLQKFFLPLKNAYKYSFLSQTERLTTRIILYQTQTLLRAFLCAKTDSFLLECYHWFIFDIRSSKDTLFLFFQISHCIQTFMLYLGSVWSLKLRERVSSSFVSYLREFYSQD